MKYMKYISIPVEKIFEIYLFDIQLVGFDQYFSNELWNEIFPEMLAWCFQTFSSASLFCGRAGRSTEFASEVGDAYPFLPG